MAEHRYSTELICMLIKRNVFAILGPNGAGKTTLLRAITNLAPVEGDVIFEGKSLVNIEPYKIPSIGIVQLS